MKNLKLWSTSQPFAKPIKDARKKTRGRNPTTSIFANKPRMRENFVKSMAMQAKAQMHEESKLWSTSQHFSKTIRDARKKTRGRNPTISIFAHHAKPQETAKEFCTLCEISHGMQNLLVHQLRYIFISNIWCNFLVSPCNQPRYFIIYLFIYLLGSIYIKRETEGDVWMFFIKHL